MLDNRINVKMKFSTEMTFRKISSTRIRQGVMIADDDDEQQRVLVARRPAFAAPALALLDHEAPPR